MGLCYVAVLDVHACKCLIRDSNSSTIVNTCIKKNTHFATTMYLLVHAHLHVHHQIC